MFATGTAPLRGAADAPATPTGGEKRPIREELQKLTPEERQARQKERREKMTPEQREAQRKVWRERLEKRQDELKKKKSDGTLTPQEEKRLERMQDLMKRWDQGGGTNAVPSKPADKPSAPAEPK